MTQNNPADKQILLDDCNVWIIDDAIPVYLLESENEIFSSRLGGVDRGFLYRLLTVYGDRWDDPPLKALCAELLEKTKQITAFRFPDHAVQHLDRGGPVPDVVVFDWEYTAIDNDRRAELLQCLLSRCVSAVLIYTDREVSVVEKDIQQLPPYCGKRLAAPRHKSRTDAAEVLSAIQEKLDTSLSARLAKKLRRVTSEAIESLLVRADQLPLDVAVRMMTEEVPEDQQFVELLSSKASAALGNCQELSDSVREWVVAQGIPPAHVKDIVAEVVSTLVAGVQQAIQYDRDVFEQISAAWRKAKDSNTSPKGEASVGEAVRDFFALRLYDQPNDTIVRTGDLVSFDTDDSSDCASPNLYMVITPPCDLARFWKNTGGRITFVQLYPETQGRSMAPAGYMPGNSITARNPMPIPSVPVKGNRLDYLLFAHDIRSEYITKLDSGECGEEYGDFLTYDHLKGKLRRYCRVSEPFLAGILAKLSETLFRAGVYDFPREERERIQGPYKEMKKKVQA